MHVYDSYGYDSRPHIPILHFYHYFCFKKEAATGNAQILSSMWATFTTKHRSWTQKMYTLSAKVLKLSSLKLGGG